MILVNDFNITGLNILLWQAINLGLILIVLFGIWKFIGQSLKQRIDFPVTLNFASRINR